MIDILSLEKNYRQRHFSWRQAFASVAVILLSQASGFGLAVEPSLIAVGPNRAIKSINEAAGLARDGSVIEIDPGDYTGDVAVWTQDRLTLRGLGNVRLIAGEKSAESKAIWVIRGGEVLVDNITFTGARVPDHNGAGIRFEKGRLTIRNSRFLNNENGILTNNQTDSTLSIEYCEFGHNGAGDGQSHNLYVGTIAHLSVIGSYFHHANVGHLFKSRAKESVVRYNRLTDETSGRASYELDFPNGGTVLLLGNIIQQSPTTENSHLLAFGAEGYRWKDNSLTMSHNTFVDERPSGGIFLRIAKGIDQMASISNLFVGTGKVSYPPEAIRYGDARGHLSDLVSVKTGDFRLRRNVKTDTLFAPPLVSSTELPEQEYVHPMKTRPLAVPLQLPGALQGRTKDAR